MKFTAIDHATIDEHEMIERYVAGKLSPEEITAFEEHYLDCEACIERIETAERMRRGLGRIAEEETARALRRGLLAGVAAWARRHSVPLAALVLVAFAAPLAWQGWRLTELQHDLEIARAEAEAALEPGATTRIFSLSPFRDAGFGEPPRHEITLPPTGGWVVLALDAEAAPAHRATLYRGDEAVWRSEELRRDEEGLVVVSFHSSFFEEGEYELELEAVSEAGGPGRTARYPIRVRSD